MTTNDTPLRLRALPSNMRAAFQMPVGEFALPPFVPRGRYDLPPADLHGLVERVGFAHFHDPVMSAFQLYRLAECRGDLLFLRRRSAPAWTKTLFVGAHDIYSADPLAGAESCVVVYFEPGAMGWAAGMPARAVRNVIAPIAAVWGDDGARLHQRLAGMDDDEEVLREMIRAVQARPRGDWQPQCLELIRTLERHAGSIQVGDLAGLCGFSERHLLRLFDRQVGLNPKLVLRIIRIRAAIAALRERPDPDWVELASLAGYADQPHLISEFRHFTGMTPTEVLRSQTLGLIVTHEMMMVPRPIAGTAGMPDPQRAMADRPRS